MRTRLFAICATFLLLLAAPHYAMHGSQWPADAAEASLHQTLPNLRTHDAQFEDVLATVENQAGVRTEIGRDGKIAHVFEKVKPQGHDQQVLEWLQVNGTRPDDPEILINLDWPDGLRLADSWDNARGAGVCSGPPAIRSRVSGGTSDI